MSPWVKLHDGFDVDWRVDSVSDEAAGLFIKACTFSARELTDGRVPGLWLERKVPGKKARDRIVAQLLDVGLLRSDGSDYLLAPVVDNDAADQLVVVFFKETVRAHRERERERKAAQRRRSRSEGDTSADVALGHPEGHPPGQLSDSGRGPWYASGSGQGTQRGVEGDEVTRAGAREAIDAEAEAERLESKFPELTNANGNAPKRPDVQGLCELHADLIESNTGTRPEPTTEWFHEFRFLLDFDKRQPAEARRLLRWVHRHPFWASRTLQPKSFRRNYDAIRMQELEGENDPDAPDPDEVRRELRLNDTPFVDPDEWVAVFGPRLSEEAGWSEDRIAEAAQTDSGQRLAQSYL
jgi:hypothetical protein